MAIHLTLDHLEPGDLPFCLPVGPGLGNGGKDRVASLEDAAGKSAQKTVLCCRDPGVRAGGSFGPDHMGDLMELAGHIEIRPASLDGGDGHGRSSAKVIATDWHRLRSSRRSFEMSRSLFWLSDEAWAAIEPHMPENGQEHVGSMTGG